MYGNLHLHSTHSDGVDPPETLVKLGKALGFRALALTDHDTVTGWEDFARACETEGVECLLGCEFYCAEGNTVFHMVGLGFDPEHPEIRALLERGYRRAKYKMDRQLEGALRAGILYDVTAEEFYRYLGDCRFPANDHLFRLLCQKGHLSFWDYPAFAKGFARYAVPLEGEELAYPLPGQVIRALKAAGGISILAHPGLGNRFAFLPEMARQGLDAVETYHADHRPEDIRLAEQYAAELGLLVSGGTDHSGEMGGQYRFYPEPEKTEYYVRDRDFGVTRENLSALRERMGK